MGVVFDLDGTLVGSEFLAPLAWAEVLREAGVVLPEGEEVEEVARVISTPGMRGSAAFAIAEHMIALYGISPQYSAYWLAERKRAVAVEQVVSGGVDLSPLWFEGAAEAVHRLGSALGLGGVGLCTSNLRPIVNATLEAGGMAQAFGGGTTVQEDVFNAEGFPQLKPKPVPYERALGLMGRPAPAVVAVEDSVVGVCAAVAAGVGVVLGVLNLEQEGNEAAAESEKAASELLAAGAWGVFRTTAEAADWCIANAAEDSALCSLGTGPLEGGDLQSACEDKEAVVCRYFAGVNAKDRAMIASCFADTVELRDMCGISRGAPRTATAADMGDRCMEFVAAHPDVEVYFEEPPRADRDGRWVWCHWAENGTWAGESCGLAPEGTPLDVSGQTRFLLEERDGEQKIVKQVSQKHFN
eukprot:gene11479-13566_t